MTHSIKWIFLLAIFHCISTSAQVPMSLRQCMEYALRQSTEKAIQRTHNDDARVQRRQSILEAFTPYVSAGTNVYTNFGRTIDPETNSYISTTSFNNGYSVNAGLTLFKGLTALNQIKIAQMAVKMGLSREQQLNDEICLSVMQAYFDVLFQSEMHRALSLQVETARQHLQLLNRQYELGEKGYADVAQVEADLSEREYQLIQCHNQKNESLFNLKALMLWSVQDTLILENPGLESLPLPVENQLTPSVGDLIDFAQQHQPSAQLAKGQLETARYELRSARGNFLPTLSLNGGWSTSYYTYPGKENYKAPSFSTQFCNNGGEYIQLSLSIPIYDAWSRTSNLKRKKNAYRRAEATYRQTLQDIEIEVARALQDCKGARAACLQADKRFKVQAEAYRLSRKQFEQGLVSPIDFQTIANAQLNALAERCNAFLKYQLKQSVVNFYRGLSYLEQQQ